MSFSYEFPRMPRLMYLKKATGLDIRGKTILDLGGNSGNLLKDGLETGEIDQSNYTCIDIDQTVIEKYKKIYPNASWITRPVKHQVYHTHEYDSDLDFSVFSESFDVIFAYSVYTHDTCEKMWSDLNILYKLLKHDGVLCCSYISKKIASVFLEKRIKEYGSAISKELIDDVQDYVYYVDNDKLVKNYDRSIKCNHFLTVFNDDWLSLELEKRFENVAMKWISPMQPCFVITKEY